MFSIFTIIRASRCLAFFVALILPSLIIAQQVGDARIVHIPPAKAVAKNEIFIEGWIEGDTDTPVHAYVSYRSIGHNDFKLSEMVIDNWNISGSIPADDVTVPGIEYYLIVDYPSGIRVTFPVNAPELVKPFIVNVAPIGAGARKRNQDIEILNPAPGAQVEGNEVLIALLLNLEKRSFNLDSLRLELNGVNVTKRTFFSGEIVSLTIKQLRPGEHRIALYEYADGIKKRIYGWGFQVIGSTKSDIPEGKLPIKGSLSGRYHHENISSRKRDITTVDTKISGKYAEMNLRGQVYITSLESGDIQPQNRYLGIVNRGNLTLKVGDTQPRFSPYSLWGNRTRGAELDYKYKSFRIQAAVGNLLRPTEGARSVSLDTSYVTDDNGDTTGIEIDSTIYIRSGTYHRTILAIRPGFKVSRNGFLSFNMVKAKDDLESINIGSNPKDNFAFGFDLELHSTDRRLQFKTETALSMFNNDITDGPMEKAKGLEAIIIVNQYFEPLPIDSAIFADDVSVVDLGFKVMQELLVSSLAHTSSLTANFFRNQVKFVFQNVGRSYRTLGNPSIRTDQRGFSISDRVRLFESHLYLNGGYEYYRENVNGRAETTMGRQTLYGGFSVYTSPEYPNLNLNTRRYGRENDDELSTIRLPDGSSAQMGNPVKDLTMSYDLSLDQTFQLAGFDHSAALSINSSSSEDDNNPDAASSLTSTTLRISSRKGSDLETTLAFSKTNQNSLNDANKVDYNVVAAKVRYMLLPKLLWLSGGINSTLAEGGFSPLPTDINQVYSGYKLNFKRFELSFGATINFQQQHDIGFSAYRVFHTDDGYQEEWNWGGSDWGSVIKPNTEQPNYISQDDFVIRLTYKYNF